MVIMPKKAAIHIQKMAPGPPETMAVATPAMLPTPTVAASAVHRASFCLVPPDRVRMGVWASSLRPASSSSSSIRARRSPG